MKEIFLKKNDMKKFNTKENNMKKYIVIFNDIDFV